MARWGRGYGHWLFLLIVLLTAVVAIFANDGLATRLWLHVLEARGIRIGWGEYCRVGVVLTLPVLLVTLLELAA